MTRVEDNANHFCTVPRKLYEHGPSRLKDKISSRESLKIQYELAFDLLHDKRLVFVAVQLHLDTLSRKED